MRPHIDCALGGCPHCPKQKPALLSGAQPDPIQALPECTRHFTGPVEADEGCVAETGHRSRAGGFLIPKKEDSADISQFRQNSFLNIDGKIFSAQWHQLQAAKRDGGDLHVMFLFGFDSSCPY